MSKTLDGIGDMDVFTGNAGKSFGDVEWLGEEFLDTAGATDDEFIFWSELVDTENGDDILEVLIALEDALNASGNAEVFFADDNGVEGLRGRGEGVDSRVDSESGDTAFEDDGGVEVGEGIGGRGVGEVICGDVDGLERGDGAALGGRYTFLEFTHFLAERWLVTDS